MTCTYNAPNYLEVFDTSSGYMMMRFPVQLSEHPHASLEDVALTTPCSYYEAVFTGAPVYGRLLLALFDLDTLQLASSMDIGLAFTDHAPWKLACAAAGRLHLFEVSSGQLLLSW